MSVHRRIQPVLTKASCYLKIDRLAGLVVLLALLLPTSLFAASRDTPWRVTEIYVATMGYAPDAEGLDYWVSNIQDLPQWTPTTVAQSFFDQPLVQTEYPSDQGYGPFVEALYQNIFGRAADSEGYAYWLGELESGRVQRNQMVIALIEGGWANPEAATDMARFANRVEVGLAFADYQRENGVLYSALTADDQEYLRNAGAKVLDGIGSDHDDIKRGIASIAELLDPVSPIAAKREALIRYFEQLEDASDQRLVSGQFLGYGPQAAANAVELLSPLSRVPMILGMDLGYYDDEQTAREAGIARLIEHAHMGGMVTLSWHADNPWTDESEDTGPSMKDGLLTDLIEDDCDTTACSKWQAQLAWVGDHLAALRDAGAVVIWRPLHEMNGTWFWWGDRPPEEFKALWHHMHDYLTIDRRLANLVWLYSPDDGYDGITTYDPGAQHVDLAGIDVYFDIGPTQGLSLSDNVLRELHDLGYPFGLSEFGPHPPGYCSEEPLDSQYVYTKLLHEIGEDFTFFFAWDCQWALAANASASEMLLDPNIIALDQPAGPQILSTEPANGAAGVPTTTSTIQVLFDRLMDIKNWSITGDGVWRPGDVRWQDGRTLIIDREDADMMLPAGERRQITLNHHDWPAEIRSADGQPLDEYILFFTTETYPSGEVLFQDDFDDPFLNDWDTSLTWTGCADIEPWTPAHFRPPYAQEGELVFSTDSDAFPIGADTWCYSGLPSKEKMLSGNFELDFSVEDFSVSTEGGGDWRSNLRLRLEEELAYPVGKKIVLDLAQGYIQGDYYTCAQISYVVDGSSQDIGGNSTDRTKLQKCLNGLETSGEMRVRRRGSIVEFYFNDERIGAFSINSTSEMRLSWIPSAWNLQPGTVIGMDVRVSEIRIVTLLGP